MRFESEVDGLLLVFIKVEGVVVLLFFNNKWYYYF